MNQGQPLLSVLICTVPTRMLELVKIVSKLVKQADRANFSMGFKAVEIIYLGDNFCFTTGQKRNILKYIGRGFYKLFVDDDDDVADIYLSELIKATKTKRHVINFVVNIILNGQPAKPVYYSLRNKKDINLKDKYLRLPNHLMAWRHDIIDKIDFPDQIMFEDAEFAKSIKRVASSEHIIHKILYTYYANTRKSEAIRRHYSERSKR